MMFFLKSTATYPFVLFLIPSLSLYLGNMDKASVQDLYRPLALSSVFWAILWVILTVLVRNRDKKAILLGSSALAFFTYASYIRVLSRLYDGLGDHRGTAMTVLSGIVSAVLLYGLYRFVRSKKSMSEATPVFNAMGFAVLLLIVGSIVFRSTFDTNYETAIMGLPEKLEKIETPDVLPDIYHIVLDAYGRADMLKKYYHQDNSLFVKALQSRGFYVAENSSSNYAQTSRSLSSMLNLQYHPDSENPRSKVPVKFLMQQNLVRRFLERHGYTTIAFASGYSPTEMRSADRYLQPLAVMTEFERTLCEYTPIRTLLAKGIIGGDSSRLTRLERDMLKIPILSNSKTIASKWSRSMQRDRIRYTLDRLREGKFDEGPIYVFAHIVCPHEPYVFDKNGDAPDLPELGPGESKAERMRSLYAGQVQFINKEILDVIDAIQQRSPNAVILLHGDHGPRFFSGATEWKDYVRCLTGILNALYLPGTDAERILYQHVSPVNTYRVVFNEYFNANIHTLKDIRFVPAKVYSGPPWRFPHDFIALEEPF